MGAKGFTMSIDFEKAFDTLCWHIINCTYASLVIISREYEWYIHKRKHKIIQHENQKTNKIILIRFDSRNIIVGIFKCFFLK